MGIKVSVNLAASIFKSAVCSTLNMETQVHVSVSVTRLWRMLLMTVTTLRSELPRFRTLRVYCGEKTLALKSLSLSLSLGLRYTFRCSQSITSTKWLTVEYCSYLMQNEFQEELRQLDFPFHQLSVPSFPDIFVRITRGVRKKRDLFCLLLVLLKLHFLRHLKVFLFLSSFSLFRRITNLNISPQQDGKCRFINLSLSLEKLQQSS